MARQEQRFVGRVPQRLLNHWSVRWRRRLWILAHDGLVPYCLPTLFDRCRQPMYRRWRAREEIRYVE